MLVRSKLYRRFYVLSNVFSLNISLAMVDVVTTKAGQLAKRIDRIEAAQNLMDTMGGLSKMGQYFRKGGGVRGSRHHVPSLCHEEAIGAPSP